MRRCPSTASIVFRLLYGLFLAIFGDVTPANSADGLGGAPSPVDIILTELDRQADQFLAAKEVVSLYENYIKEVRPDGELLKRLTTRIERIKAAADMNHVRLGAKWVPSPERERALELESALFKEAQEAFERAERDPAQGQLARQKLELASKTNPDGVAADYVLGLVYATLVYDMDKAEEHFKKVLARQPASTEAMVNLAVIEIKAKKWSAAVAHLRLASVGAVDRTEVVQNVGRVIASGRQKTIAIEPAWLNKFESLGKELAASDPGLKHDPKLGWLYSPLVAGLPSENTGAAPVVDKSELILKGRALGFSPAPGLILTHRDVATLDMGQVPAAFSLRWRGMSERPEEADGRFLASDQLLGLSLLECEQCDVPALRIATEQVPADFAVTAGKSMASKTIGSSVSISPFPTNMRSSRKTTFGVVHRLEPNPTVAVLGSPLIGADGKVYGLVAGFPPTPGDKATSPWGIGSDRLLKFLEKVAPEAKLPQSLQSARGEIDTEFLGGRAVLIEMYGRELSVGKLFDSGDFDDKMRRRPNRSLEDPACTWCGGSGAEDCLVRQCKDGAVTEYVPVEMVVGVGAGARTVTKRQPVQVRCTHCDGVGKVECRRCKGTGRDPSVD